MSNHDGSYLLNEVLRLLEERGLFTQLGPETTQQLVRDIVRLSSRYDCNRGEILEEIGERLGICYLCLSANSDLIHGECGSCRNWKGRS